MSDGTDLLAALTPVVEAFDVLGVRYQIGGSVASSVHGAARSTLDVDLVGDLTGDQVEPLVQALGQDYYADPDMIHEAIRDRSSFNLIHERTMLKVDVFLPKDRPYDREALSRRTADQLEEGGSAREFFVATPEDVVLAKLEWYAKGGRVSERQWGDILGVLRVQGEALDRDYLRRWAAELGLVELLAQAVAEA